MTYTYSLAPDRAWPKTHEQRAKEWARRRSAFRGGEYTDDDFKRMYLFQGCNARGQVIIKTRRVSPMLAFVANVDAACIAGCPSLEIRPGAFPDVDGKPGKAEIAALDEGRAIMRRAAVEDSIAVWSTSYATEGDLYFEVGTDDEGEWTFYPLAPETVDVQADKFGRVTRRAVIAMDYTKAGEATPTKYKRTVTVGKDGRIKTEDGESPVDDVPNVLAVSTVVWVPFDPVPGSYGFSKCAFTDIEDLVAKADSATTQMSAIGTRWADPTLITKGFALVDEDPTGDLPGTGAKSAQIGKTLAMQKDEEASYLTVDLTSVESLVNATATDLENARKALPEYMFSDASASSSGLAMSYQATALVAKLEPRRDRLYGAIARMVGMCRAAAMGKAWTPDMDIYVVTGPPILPMDKAAQVQILISLKEAGAITAEDFIGHLQALGFIDPSHDPKEYADAVALEADALDAKAHSLATALTGGGAKAADPSTDPAQAADPNAAVMPTAATVADTALNGAQAAFVLDAVTQAQSGAIPKSAAIIAVQLALPTTDPAQIVAMFGDVVEGSTAPAAINPSQAQPAA